MKEQIVRIFKSLKFSGFDSSLDLQIQKRILLFNKISILLVLISFTVASVYWKFGIKFNSLFTYSICLSFLLSFFLMHWGYYNASRIFFLIMFNVGAFINGYTLGPDTKIGNIFFALALLPFIIFSFEERIKIFALAVLSVLLRLVLALELKFIENALPQTNPPDSMLSTMFYLMQIIPFVVILKVSFDFVRASDLVEKKLINKNLELEKLKLRHQAILNSSLMGILELDKTGLIEFANEQAAKELGYEIDELIGRDVFAIYKKKQSDLHQSILQKTEYSCDVDFFWTRNGTTIPVSICLSKLKRNDYDKGMVLFFQNIASQLVLKRNYEEAKLKINYLDKANSLADIFFRFAHELKNPLNIIFNYSEVMPKQIADLKSELKNNPECSDVDILMTLEYEMGVVKVQAERMVKIFDQISKSQEILSDESCNVSLEEVIKFSTVLFAREHMSLLEKSIRPIQFEFHFAPQLSKCYLKPLSLVQVLYSIFENADLSLKQKLKSDIQFSPKISIKTVNDNKNIKIVIEDNGMGVSEGELENITHAFYTTWENRSGLGLSYVKSTVEGEMNGKVEVVSEAGNFFRITIILPVPV